MTPLVIQIVILFVKILAELLLIILVPAFALKFFKKDLSFGLAFSASILMILLPVLTYVNNAELNNTILPFAAWGVASVLTLSWMTWGCRPEPSSLFCMRLTSSLKAAPAER